LDDLWGQKQVAFPTIVVPKDQHWEISVRVEQAAFSSCWLNISLPYHFEPGFIIKDKKKEFNTIKYTSYVHFVFFSVCEHAFLCFFF
jgi:hypothetical protein